METIRGMRKNKKKEKENKKKKGNDKKGKAISQRRYRVDDAEEWSVEELLLD